MSGAAYQNGRKKAQNCVAKVSMGGEVIRCGAPLAPDADRYCESHKSRSSGKTEMNRAVAKSQTEMIVPAPKDTTIAQKVERMVDNVLAFEDDAREAYLKVPEDERRFTDEHGGEQMRSEIAVYERALDRSARVLREVARLGIETQMIRLNREHLDLIRRAIDQTFVSMGMSRKETNNARKILAEQLRQMEVKTSSGEGEAQDITDQLSFDRDESDVISIESRRED